MKALLDVSFSGCGFLGMYHVGSLTCLQKFQKHVEIKRSLGASLGSVVACASLLNYPAPLLREKMNKVISNSRKLSFGAFNPAFDVSKILREELFTSFPDEVAIEVTGKLFVSLTKPSMTNVIVSEFLTKKELLDSLSCSCFIPAFSGYRAVYFRGKPYLDGGFTNNLPIFDDKTVTVSPFAGKTKHVAPVDNPRNKLIKVAKEEVEFSAKNAKRGIQALRIPTEIQLEKDFNQGFQHTELFLRKMLRKSLL